MPRRVMVAALIICLLPVPSTLAAHAVAVGAAGPDPDGAYDLTYDIHRDAPGVASLALDVARTDADGTLAGSRALGTADLPAGSSTRTVRFLPAEGPGRYVVAILVDGVRGGELAFDVDDASATASVRFEVADAPTYLDLANDSVNADGKTKSPGEALLTRALVRDANGLAELDGIAWSAEREGASAASGIILPPTNVTSWSFEHRFDRAPFEAGNYTMRLSAIKGAATVATVSRTFVIREVAPTFVSGSLTSVLPDEAVLQTSALVLADKNGIPTNSFDPRVYRGSARVEGNGFTASLGTPTRLSDANDSARVSYPLTLAVPARAASGAYRVSVYADGALLATLPFDVLPLPTLTGANASTVAGRLIVDAHGSGDGVLLARLGDGNGATTTVSAPFTNGSGTVTLDAPRRGGILQWNVSLLARTGGPTLASREGDWSPPSDGADLALEAVYARARLPAVWRVNSSWSLAEANATFTFTRWDGQPETRITGTLAGDKLRLQAPPDITAGRYGARVVIAWPNTSTSEATWTFDAGPWVELSLGAPAVNGSTATLPVHNVGGVSVSRIVVQAEPAASLTLQRAGQNITPTVVGGFARFAVTLAPGDEASLRVELPSGPTRSGRHDIDLRVLARVEIG